VRPQRGKPRALLPGSLELRGHAEQCDPPTRVRHPFAELCVERRDVAPTAPTTGRLALRRMLVRLTCALSKRVRLVSSLEAGRHPSQLKGVNGAGLCAAATDLSGAAATAGR